MLRTLYKIKIYWNKSLGFYGYKCSYVKRKLFSFYSFPACSSSPRFTSPWDHPVMYMETVLTMCTPLTLKSMSKQAGALDTFLCHSSSWNTRCERVIAMQKIYKNMFSLYLFSFLLLFEVRKKHQSSEF